MDFIELLNEIGLSEYEKKVYTTLLTLDKAKSREISKESKVSYGRIYDILEGLESKGLVSYLPTSPKTFEAIDPKVALKILLKRRAEELQRLETGLLRVKLPEKRYIEENAYTTIMVYGKQKQMNMLY